MHICKLKGSSDSRLHLLAMTRNGRLLLYDYRGQYFSTSSEDMLVPQDSFYPKVSKRLSTHDNSHMSRNVVLVKYYELSSTPIYKTFTNRSNFGVENKNNSTDHM